MKKMTWIALIGILVSLVSATAMVTAAKVTMNGSYEWNRQAGQPGDLRAEFSEVETGVWDVSFYFEFREKKHVYSGRAEGSLENGALKGEVQNENKNRTWRFKGICKKGAFSGTHVEMKRDGSEKQTGTLTLTVAK